MMITDSLRQGIGSMLWRGSLGERRAIGIFGRLLRGSLLTPDEKAALPAIIEEEIQHGDLLRACAKRYLPTRIEIPRPLFHVREHPEHVLVAALHAAERFEAPGMPLARALFLRLGDTEAVRAYEILIRDEAGHIAWGRRVMERLRVERPEWRAELSGVRPPLLTAYKAARAARWFLRDL